MRLAVRAALLLEAASLLLVLVAILALLGDLWWALDLLSHFRWQCVAAAGILGLALAGLRRWRGAALASVALLLHGWPIAAALSAPAPAGGAHDLRVVLYNVHAFTDPDAEALAFLAGADADVVLLFEATAAWRDAVAAALPDHHIAADAARPDPSGAVAFARGAVERAEVLDLAGTPALALQLRRGAVLGIHPLPPIRAELAAAQNEAMDAAARWARAQHGAAIVAGDFNATPWSRAMRRLVDRGRLLGSRPAAWQASWRRGPWPLRLPIDHLLHGDAWVLVARGVGPFFGSDHRPVIVDLRWRGSD